MTVSAYPGRIIFDHLPKTGGQALADWLANTLGGSCVFRNTVTGLHRNLIQRYGGLYSIICGHLEYLDGDELDLRYQYITCIREPIDRAISLLYFFLALPGDDVEFAYRRNAARTFLESEGDEYTPDSRLQISNVYVNHFSRIGHKTSTLTGAEKLSVAGRAIRRYDVAGCYADIPRFVNDVAALIGITAAPDLARVNVTAVRPSIDRISDKLKLKLIELNSLDIQLYRDFTDWKAESSPIVEHHSILSAAPKWLKYETFRPVATNGSISVVGSLPSILHGTESTVRCLIANGSYETWLGDVIHPIRASYHWLTSTGAMYRYDGYRTPLPPNGIAPGRTLECEVRILAPSEPGEYLLVLTLVQEQVAWFEQGDFTPAKLRVCVA